jgi:arrestin-related trafficking adapter 4/5/7
MREAGISYKLKATISRGKWNYDIHTDKNLRIVRTLESSALEVLHAMSVENIWPNKIEYSIVIPQKAIVFGSAIPLETRFTPLLKGLEIGDVTAKLVEAHDVILTGTAGNAPREFKREKVVATWVRSITREEHWHDIIEETEQEGWVFNTTLDLPKKLGKVIQDAHVMNVKIRHKLKLVVALKNPDGHISEVRAPSIAPT